MSNETFDTTKQGGEYFFPVSLSVSNINHSCRSLVFTWFLTFFLLYISFINSASGTTGYNLERGGILTTPNAPTQIGMALATGGGGEIYVLFDIPPRILVWKDDNFNPVEYDLASDVISSPVDIAADGSFGLLLADQFTGSIKRFDRRLQPLPAVKPTTSGTRIEPASVCRVADGTLFFINRTDDDVWRVDRQGQAYPLGWSRSGDNSISRPKRLEYSSSLDMLLIIDQSGVRVSLHRGMPSVLLRTSVDKPRSISVSDNEAWVVGEGLGCISLKTRREVYFAPIDSLRAWKVYPCADLALSHDAMRLYLLAESGGIVFFNIKRQSRGQP